MYPRTIYNRYIPVVKNTSPIKGPLQMHVHVDKIPDKSEWDVTIYIILGEIALILHCE